MPENSKSNRKLAAIMFADIVSYSRLMGANETEALKLVKDFDTISIPIVEKHGGEVIKKNGDQIFCEFSSAKQAVDASILIQEKLHNYNDSRPVDFKLEVRIGIHIGDVLKENNDVFGDGVNVAARIQPLADPGGISISGSVSEALSSHPEYKLKAKGKHELKNIVNKHSIYNVYTGYESTGPIKDNASSMLKKILIMVLLGIITGVIIYFQSDTFDTILQEKQEDKRIFITKLLSNNLEVLDGVSVKQFFIALDADGTFESVENDSVVFSLLTKTEKNNYYDELLSYLDHDNSNYELITHYDYSSDRKSKGQSVFNYTEAPIFILAATLMKISPGLTLDKVLDAEANSLFQIINDNNYDVALCPIIYKINEDDDPSEYIGVLLTLKFSMDGEDASFSLAGVNIPKSNPSNLSRELSFHINAAIRTYLMDGNDNSQIRVVGINDDEYILKFTSDYKGLIKERMILKADRYLLYNKSSNTDSLLNARYNDLALYKDDIDKDPNSTYYKHFYEELNPVWSLKEMENLKSGGLLEYGSGAWHLPLEVSVKVTNIYDSTATAIIYIKDNPYKELRIGDFLSF